MCSAPCTHMMKANKVNNAKKKRKKTLSITEAIYEWIFCYAGDDEELCF